MLNNQLNGLIAQGYSEENARTEVGKVVAVPSTSEHQLLLAVDIVDIENQEKTAVQKWLMENSWRYERNALMNTGCPDICNMIWTHTRTG